MEDEYCQPTFPLKRYLLFGGRDYYALGGCWDLLDSYGSKDEALEVVSRLVGYDSKVQWAQILDSWTGETANFSHRHDYPVTVDRPTYYYND